MLTCWGKIPTHKEKTKPQREMKLEEGAKVRGCQFSVLVPLLLPSLPAHPLRPAPYRHPALEGKP